MASTEVASRGAAPLYIQIADDLGEAIERGDYRTGDQLPPKKELVKSYGVSQQTVQNAIDHLRGSGLVASRRGAGTFVQAPPKLKRLSRNRLGSSRRDARRGGFFLDAEVAGVSAFVQAEVRIEEADPETARLLAIEAGESVLVRDRVMHAGDEPVELARTLIPRRLTRGTLIEEVDSGPGGSMARLEESGHTIAYFVEAVSARRATRREAELLDLRPETSVLCVQRVGHGADGEPIEVTHMTIASDRYELVYEIAAE
jgi:GntR family transcriptional regulator